MSKKDQLERKGQLIEELVNDPSFKPLENLDYNDPKTIKLMEDIARIDRPCLSGQVAGVQALLKSLLTYKVGILQGEPGIGKSQISFVTMYSVFLHNEEKTSKKGTSSKFLFVTVGKLLNQMRTEIKEVLGDKVVTYEIVNKYKIEKGKKTRLKSFQVFPEDVINMPEIPGKMQVFFVSKDTAKYGLKEEVVLNWGDLCPSCGTKLLPKSWEQKTKKFPEGWKTHVEDFYPKLKPLNCPECLASCEAPVSEPIIEGNIIFKNRSKKILNRKGPRKISIGQRFRKQIKKRAEHNIFEMVVVDEVHEMQSPTSIQGKVYRDLVNVSKRAMIMTGTLSNGYPSSIFYILQAILPMYFKEKGYTFYDVGKFVAQFGTRKIARSKDRIEKKGSKTVIKTSEMPQISESIVGFLAPFTYWIKMEDLNLPMPAYREDPFVVEMDPDVRMALDEYKKTVVDSIRKHNKKLLMSFAQRFVYLQNNPTFEFVYEFDGVKLETNNETGEVEEVKAHFVHKFNPLPEDRIYSKEKALINYIRSELNADRNVMVYSIYNKVAGISARLGKLLSEAFPDKRVVVMPETIGGSRILPWIEANPAEIMVCSPLKVSTGLNLTQFPTIAFYETGTNLRVVQQASRRSWRAFGQDKAVKIPFFAYQGLQAQMLDSLGKKLKAAAIVDGRAVEGAQLASVFDDDADITAVLNNIAKDIDKECKPDFSSSIIEAGKMRPNTVYEQTYIDILESITGKSEEEMEKEFEEHSEAEVKDEVESSDTDVEVESSDTKVEDSEVESSDTKVEDSEVESSDTKVEDSEVESSDTEVEDSEVEDDKIKVACKTRQLVFDF